MNISKKQIKLKYKELFYENELVEHPSEYPFAFNDSWNELFDQMCEEINLVCYNSFLCGELIKFKFRHVSQTWGKLKIRYDFSGEEQYLDEIQDIERFYADKSQRVCCVCGEEGKVRRVELGIHLPPLCEKHFLEKKALKEAEWKTVLDYSKSKKSSIQ